MVVDVPETLGVMAKPGMSLEERTKRTKPLVNLTALPDRQFLAEIVEVSSLADPATRTYEGTLSFSPPADLHILPGMTANLIVSLEDEPDVKQDAYALPSYAVAAAENGEPYVWVVDRESMSVSRQSVQVGGLEGDRIEIRSAGLSPGDWVATSGVHVLEEGDSVRRYGNGE